MKSSRVYTAVFGGLGLFLMALVLIVSLFLRDAAPKMVAAPTGAVRCVDGLMQHLCAGDYAGASDYLYGNPTLDSGAGLDSDAAQQIWDAFTSSLSYELEGNCYATTSGVAQKVLFRSLQIPSVTSALKERASLLLEERVADAENMAEVYTSNLEYRRDFVMEVLHDTVVDALVVDGRHTEQVLTLNLICENGIWLVVPDHALINAISGGIFG